jgi:hypothetical protein
MDHLITGTDITLTYLQDRRALAAIDWPSVFDDLTDAGARPRFLWCDLDALTHVVLATERSTGLHVGAFGLAQGPIALKADFVIARPGPDHATLTRAMLAHLLSRIVQLDGKPDAIVARQGHPASEAAVRGLGAAIGGITLHPPVSGNVILLKTAALARRAGLSATMMDLRGIPAGGLLRDLARLHRMRLEPSRKVRSKAARIGGATPRPKTATRTGRSG